MKPHEIGLENASARRSVGRLAQYLTDKLAAKAVGAFDAAGYLSGRAQRCPVNTGVKAGLQALKNQRRYVLQIAHPRRRHQHGRRKAKPQRDFPGLLVVR